MVNRSKVRGSVVWVAVTFALTAVSASRAMGHTLEELEQVLGKQEFYLELTNRQPPKFTLEDADGRSVSLDDFRGKVVVLDFIYASCREACPVQSDLVASIQEAVNATPMRDTVQFISITTDPERDTPDVLKSYGTVHGLDPANWVFLTSGPDRPTATRELGERYGLKFTRTEDGDFIHALVTHVIDKNGILRGRFHGLKFDPTNVILYVNALVNEDHPVVAKIGSPARSIAASQEPVSRSPFGRTWLWTALSVFGAAVAVLTIPLWRRLHDR